MSNVLRVKPILDLIASHESESAVRGQNVTSAYDVVVWQAYQVCKPSVPLTSMTVREVILWQLKAIVAYKRIKKSRTGYSACGRYQIIRSTLMGLVRSRAVSATALYDADTQDILAFELLKRRGCLRWLAGRVRDDVFADNLSREWASLPFRNGRSFYAGDAHGNRSLVSREELMAVLQQVKRVGL